jgi:hypothetical protein
MEAGALIGGARPIVPVLPLQTTPAITQAPIVDFRLETRGVSVDAGNPAPYLDTLYHHTRRGVQPDLGAIEVGQDWTLSAGPRWAVGAKKPWRPAPPPSLDPSSMGFASPVPEPGFGALSLFGVIGLTQLARRRAGPGRAGSRAAA